MNKGVGFDKDDLDFKENKVNISDYFKKFLRWFGICSLIAVGILVVFALLFSTEEEKKLVRETKAIEETLPYLEEQMDMIEGVVDNLRAKDNEIYENIFNSEPPSFTMESPGYDHLLAESDSIDISSVIWQTSRQLEGVEGQMEYFEKLLSSVGSIIGDSSTYVKHIPCIIPIQDFSISKTGATVGEKMHPFYKTITEHTGLDLVTSVGTNVFATADGVVEAVIKSPKGKGNQVIIDHGYGYKTTYSHLSLSTVRKKQKVSRGDVIGRVGTSGRVFAPHLHYEVIYNGVYMNPIDYFFVDLTPVQYREMLMIAVNTGQSMD